jgi:ankyrin repeat protein
MLHFAAAGTNIAHLRGVISDGYDVNATNNKGETPLHIAFKHGRHENIAELVRSGANPNLKDDAGNTPMDLDKNGGCY